MIGVAYYTYFEGQLAIELKEPQLSELRKTLAEQFNNKEVIMVDETSLKVNDEWKDISLMERVVLFIQENGKLLSGSIRCDGEDPKDVWEIVISNNKPFLRELGSHVTLARTESKLEKEQKGWSKGDLDSYFSHHITTMYLGDIVPTYHVLENPDGDGWVIGMFYGFVGEYVPLEEEGEERLVFPSAEDAMNHVDTKLNKTESK